jgi:hypothetical protein
MLPDYHHRLRSTSATWPFLTTTGLVRSSPNSAAMMCMGRRSSPLFTGMRVGEILVLRWLNVDLDAKVIRVREALEETKAHGIRVKVPKTKAGLRDIGLPDIL